MDSGNLELARLQEGEMRAVDRTREMEGAGREKEKGWTEGEEERGECLEIWGSASGGEGSILSLSAGCRKPAP